MEPADLVAGLRAAPPHDGAAPFVRRATYRIDGRRVLVEFRHAADGGVSPRHFSATIAASVQRLTWRASAGEIDVEVWDRVASSGALRYFATASCPAWSSDPGGRTIATDGAAEIPLALEDLMREVLRRVAARPAAAAGSAESAP